MRGQAQTSSACDPERGCEVARVDATLGRIHPQPDHPIRLTCSPKLGQALGELQSSLAAVRAVDVADQHAARIGLHLSPFDSLSQSRDDLCEVLSGGEMPRWREEHLSVAQTVRRGIDDRFICGSSPVIAIGEQLLDQPEDLQERVERGIPIQLGWVLAS